MALRAKFKVNSITGDDQCQNVRLDAVYSSDPESENKSFADATPAGSLTMSITNKNAHGFFIEGQEYYLDIAPALQVAPINSDTGETKTEAA